MTIIAKHTQKNVTELRIAIEQMDNSETEQDLAKYYQNVACIMQSIMFSVEDIKTNKLDNISCSA